MAAGSQNRSSGRGLGTTEELLALTSELAPQLQAFVAEMEEEDEFPPAALRLLADAGFLRLTLPEAWGGSGLAMADYFPVLERLAVFGGSVRLLVHGQNVLWRPIVSYGTPEQQQQWLPRFAAGEIVAFGLTEPDNGTGRDLTMSARRDGGEWVLNGTKHLISWAGEAQLIYLLVRTHESGEPELTCFVAEAETEGLECTRQAPGMGSRGSHQYVVTIKDCRLPESALLGKIGEGLEILLREISDISRVSIAVACVAVAERAIALSAKFANRRVTFGRPIAERQAIQMNLAEMAADVFAVRSAATVATARYDRGQPIVAEAAICKLLALEMVGRVTDKAMRLHGGLGYLASEEIERHYRDARAMWFEEGTAEIQKLLIARQVLTQEAAVV